jgi:hypothetical protein
MDEKTAFEDAEAAFAKIKKEILNADEISNDLYEKTLNISSRTLGEYILYRARIIQRLKECGEEDSEGKIHDIVVPRKHHFEKKTSMEDLRVNNAWLLDDKYMSYSHNDHSVFSIPKTCVNVEAACATLELMNELSYKEVTPVIFEDALKIKYSADEVTASMLDIVRSGLSFDAGWIYSNTLGNLAQNTLSNLIANKSKDLASRYASIQSTLDTNLTELVTYLEANQ